MPAITEVTKDGKVYKNIDLRNLEYNEPMELEVATDSPREFKTKFGLSKMFLFKKDGEFISGFINDSLKSKEYGKNLSQILSGYKAGEFITITKKEGKSKDGVSFRYFDVVGKNQGQSLNLATPSKLNLTPPKTEVYSDKEQAIIKALKTDPNCSSFDNEQRIAVITQNGISESRAKDIVSKNF